MNLKTFLLAAIALIVLLAGAYWLYGNLEAEQETGRLAAAAPSETAEETTTPDFTVYDSDGNPAALSDFSEDPLC